MWINSWTNVYWQGVNLIPYTQQEKEAALILFDETESIAAVINKLGYPSRHNMNIWIKIEV